MNVPPRHRIGGYQEFAPSADVAFFAEASWVHRAPRAPVPPGAAHRVLPEFAVSLAFDVTRDEQGRPVEGRAIVIGAKRRPQLFAIVPGRELTAVRLKPEWTAVMLGIDPLDLESRIVDAADIRPRLAARLHEALWRTRSAEDAIPILWRAIREGRVSKQAPAPSARAALEAVRRTEGRVACEDVARHVGLSPRHLRRQVRDAAGISPKKYARMLRLLTAMRIADASAHPSWADVALAAGYCDQSHLIRECLQATDNSPAELHRERRDQVIDMAEMSNPDY